MEIKISREKVTNDFVKKVEELSNENVLKCYQCGKCSAGCPSVEEMEALPNQIIRAVQVGEEDEVYKYNTIWICATCYTCMVRCPKGVDLCKVMEALRTIYLRDTKKDYLSPLGIPEERREELPQIALVSNFRKNTA